MWKVDFILCSFFSVQTVFLPDQQFVSVSLGLKQTCSRTNRQKVLNETSVDKQQEQFHACAKPQTGEKHKTHQQGAESGLRLNFWVCMVSSGAAIV